MPSSAASRERIGACVMTAVVDELAQLVSSLKRGLMVAASCAAKYANLRLPRGDVLLVRRTYPSQLLGTMVASLLRDPSRVADLYQAPSESKDEVRVWQPSWHRLETGQRDQQEPPAELIYPAPDESSHLPRLCRQKAEPFHPRRQARLCLLMRLRRQPLCWAALLEEPRHIRCSGSFLGLFAWWGCSCTKWVALSARLYTLPGKRRCPPPSRSTRPSAPGSGR